MVNTVTPGFPMPNIYTANITSFDRYEKNLIFKYLLHDTIH